MERRLAAILATDVVGYSRLIRADEEGTLSALKTLRSDLIDPKITEHNGRIVKLMGDGMLAEFPSVVDAVHAAVETQQAMAEHNAALPKDKRIEFRVGVNLGDVVIDGDDIQGDGVNVASRLEGLAGPGGICISGSVHEQVRDRIDIPFEDMGEQEVKNIDRPVRVWQWVNDGDVSAVRAEQMSEHLPLPDKTSIAVLPFDNLSGDPEQEYFADGVAEDIITALSKFRAFFVIARNSSFTYKGKATSVKQVSQDLGVRYVLEGSVRKAGSRVRVSAQLIDGANDAHIWAERYDRSLDDIFDLQDEITNTIVGAIAPEIDDAERARARRKPPESLDAWDLYHQGLWHLWKMKRENSQNAESLLRSAIDVDPGFSAAYAALALVNYFQVMHGWTDAPEETLDCALVPARRAVSEDDRNELAHLILGRILTLQGEFETGIAELELAIEINPNLAFAYFCHGFALIWSGRARDAQLPLHTAIRLSPRDPLRWGFDALLGSTYIHIGEYQEGIRWCKQASRHSIATFWPYVHLVRAFVELDELEDAGAALNGALDKQPDLTLTVVANVLRMQHHEYRERTLNALRVAGLPD